MTEMEGTKVHVKGDLPHGEDLLEVKDQDSEFLEKTLDYHEGESKSSSEDVLSMHSGGSPYENKPWSMKLFACVCACLLSVGSHYASHMLGSLKSTIVKDLDITNAQFGMLQSAAALINTIVPFFGGIFLDHFGTSTCSIVASSLILIGEVIVAISTEFHSFSCMILGRVIYGLGGGIIVLSQEAILSHWFRGKGLGLVFGLQIGVSRLTNWISVVSVVPIQNATGFYGNAFWVSAGLCAASWLLNVFYCLMMKYKFNEFDSEREMLALRRKHKFVLSNVFRFPPVVWFLMFMNVVLDSTWAPFNHTSAQLIEQRFHTSQTVAAFQSSVGYILPILLNPVMGLALDMIGMRSLVIVVGALCMTLGFGFLGYTMISPVLALVLYSISHTLCPIAMMSSLPIIYDVNLIGTLLGLFKCSGNIGVSIMDPVVGKIQDMTGNYDTVLLVMLIISSVGSFLTILFSIYTFTSLKLVNYNWMQLQKGNILKKNDNASEQNANVLFSCVAIGILLCLLASSWVIFFTIGLS